MNQGAGGFPHLLLQQVLGQGAGRQFLYHQVLSFLVDTGGQASKLWAAQSLLGLALPHPCLELLLRRDRRHGCWGVVALL